MEIQAYNETAAKSDKAEPPACYGIGAMHMRDRQADLREGVDRLNGIAGTKCGDTSSTSTQQSA